MEYLSWIETAVAATAPQITPVTDPSTSGNFILTMVNIGNSVITVLSLLAGILAVVYLVWAGMQYVTSGGNPERAKSGRTGIINAVIGIIIIVAAYMIIRLAIGLGATAACSDLSPAEQSRYAACRD